MPPALIIYATEAEYRDHYERTYCRAVIHTFDGIRVFFPKQQFDDAFYESVERKARDKSRFSTERAQRINWIVAALQDATAELYRGWDRDRRTLQHKRRVTIVYGDYVVVLQIRRNPTEATFITAYIAGAETLRKIRSGPRW